VIGSKLFPRHKLPDISEAWHIFPPAGAQSVIQKSQGAVGMMLSRRGGLSPPMMMLSTDQLAFFKKKATLMHLCNHCRFFTQVLLFCPPSIPLIFPRPVSIVVFFVVVCVVNKLDFFRLDDA